MLILALLTLVLHGLLAGLFYAFSMSVMPGLNAIEPAQAEAAMRSVNRKILNPWLFLVFLGSPVAALVAGLLAGGAAAVWFLAAAGVGFAGSFLVTVAVNVPMNNALDAGTMRWKDYSRRWTAWNTVRAVASTVSLALVGVAIGAL
ncbi:anthrone oxygenase family protein [Nonomuraea sp. LP-02]|uniref:anthrone oxygenase family protein n=1 Tax=Nonomuraea sp. LP-02 TaxID=3097960 RepID=UPI002E331677|nr:anthrone oxygenase family protein [Nonomuraea sp. LP-02]MED7929488.1 anthrone oxygenase family protein [Nonomuraea sp. LP-02]